MNIEQEILKALKLEHPELEIHSIRGLIKTHENEWSFRYTFREGDYLSLSELNLVRQEGLKKIVLVNTKPKKKTKIKKPVLKK